MIEFIYPDCAARCEAAAFAQCGIILAWGSREKCDTEAYKAKGLYCLWIDGKPVIKTDYAYLNDEISGEGQQG